MIQLTDVFCVVLRYKWASTEISDYNKWLILLSVIPLSGGHCMTLQYLIPGYRKRQPLIIALGPKVKSSS